ncbi:cytochrome-c peroxidase [Primorskyibacter sedentarius]|uniref:cytochrome-c peroxidase n=1 Tax=Primorskyibacter sedentarius TaxID=745311 RepID=UPI003EBB249A
MALLFLTTSPLAAQSVDPDDFLSFDPAQARIGQMLFYDKILSGNRNISCGTCHHHHHAGGDGLSLGIGEGGEGVGPLRTPGSGADRIAKRIPRNAPALWNLGHRSVTTLFHDGRLAVSDLYGNGFNSPAEEWLPQGLNNILAAQALFPMTSQFEMAGNPRENEIAGAVHDRIDAAWPILAKRVRIIPEYAALFVEAFDDVKNPEDVSIVHVANALAAFIGTEWQSHDSPYDDWMASGTPLPAQAELGRQLFFGKANCSRCHNGPLLTDHDFHAMGLPAFGPGRTRRFDPMPRDVGRMGKTDALEDAYRFRTPSLRNVALTAPYGHNGAYPTLADMIRHMADPVTARSAWIPTMARLPAAPWLEASDFVIRADRLEMARQTRMLDAEPVILTDEEVAQIEAFLHALTGRTALTRPLGRPDRVPSGLPVD